MPSGIYARETDQWRAFIEANASPGTTKTEMLMLARAKFPGVTMAYVRGVYRRSRLPFRTELRRTNSLLTEEQAAWMAEAVKDRPDIEAARLLKSKYGIALTVAQVRAWKKNHRIASGYDTRYRPGNIPANKGRRWDEFMPPESQEKCRATTFKAGHVPSGVLPVGTVRLHKDGYCYVKVAEHRWELLHRHVWESVHGEIPPDHIVMFVNGDRTDCSIENLAMASKGAACIIQTHIGLCDDAAVNKAIVPLAELELRVNKAGRNRRKQG